MFLGAKIYINNLSVNNWLIVNLGLRMVFFSQNNVSKHHLPGRTKITKCCTKTGFKLVFFQYFTNETAYIEKLFTSVHVL